MTDEKRNKLVENSLNGIRQIQRCAEMALEADTAANGNSRRRAANVMLFMIMTAPVVENIAKNCHDIAEQETDDDAECTTQA